MNQIEEFTENLDDLGGLLMDFAFFINSTCMPCCFNTFNYTPIEKPAYLRYNDKQEETKNNKNEKEKEKENELEMIENYLLYKIE